MVRRLFRQGFVGYDKSSRVIKPRTDTLLQKQLVALGVGWARKSLLRLAAFATKGLVRAKVRLRNLDRFAVGGRLVVSDKQVSEPWPRLQSLKTGTSVGGPKIVRVADAFFETVVLVVADALVLRLELDGGVKDRLSRIPLGGVEAAVRDDH